MHDLRLIHTDLKPENILLVSADYVKVPDLKVLLSSICKVFLFATLILKCLIPEALDEVHQGLHVIQEPTEVQCHQAYRFRKHNIWTPGS